MATATLSRRSTKAPRKGSKPAAQQRRPATEDIEWWAEDLEWLTTWCEDVLGPATDGALECIPFRNRRTRRLGVAIVFSGCEYHENIAEATPGYVVKSVGRVLRKLAETAEAWGAPGDADMHKAMGEDED